MKFGRLGWGAVVLGLGLATPLGARAQGVERSDPFSPATLLQGPSLQETGRIGAMTPEASGGISTGKELSLQPEKEVAPATVGIGKEPLGLTGVVDEAQLADQIAANFAALDDCRMNVARAKQVLPAGVVANTLQLRWTILPDGHTSMTRVVVTAPTDGEVIDCVKAAMQRWTFVSPRGGPVQVERGFAFRSLPQP